MALTIDDMGVLQRMLDGLESRLEAKFGARFIAQDRKFDARFDALETKFVGRFDGLEVKFESRLGTALAAAKTDIVDDVSVVINEALALAGYRVENVERRVTRLEACEEGR